MAKHTLLRKHIIEQVLKHHTLDKDTIHFYGHQPTKRVYWKQSDQELSPFNWLHYSILNAIEELSLKDEDGIRFIKFNYTSHNSDPKTLLELYTYYTFCNTLDIKWHPNPFDERAIELMANGHPNSLTAQRLGLSLETFLFYKGQLLRRFIDN